MAILPISDQYKYTKRGPLDAKALVKTYAELLNPDTWIVSGSDIAAYNGMITSVWLNKDDTTKNGIYYLFDPTITSALKAPDVTNEANWHKLAEMHELADFSTRIAAIEAELAAIDIRLSALEDDSDVLTYGYRSGFPETGEANKLYVAADEEKSYIWFNNTYISVSSTYEEPNVINGGSAN